MTLNLYLNKSDEKVTDKVIEPVATGINFNLLASTSIENPQLTIQFNPAYLVCNYVYIPDFHRYYYCTVTVDNYNIMTISCNVDVLMSFKDGIRATEQNITRSEDPKIYNLYINDPRMQALTQMQVQQKVFGNEIFNVNDMTLTDENFLLTTINAPQRTQTAGE